MAYTLNPITGKFDYYETPEAGTGAGFSTWIVDGQSDLVAVEGDTIEFVAGSGMRIETNTATDPKQIIFESDGGAALAPQYFRRDRNSATTVYSGINSSSDSEGSTSWIITRLVTDTSPERFRTVSTATGSWTNRTSLTYTPSLTYRI